MPVRAISGHGRWSPLPIAVLAGLTPPDVELSFYDDRMEAIPFDAPTDAVAIPIETYTAARAYQIASEYRTPRRAGRHGRVPRHAWCRTRSRDTRKPSSSARPRASGLGWSTICATARCDAATTESNARLAEIRLDRRLFHGKRYLPIGLVETGRGCPFPCEFCAIQTFFSRTYRADLRPTSSPS